MHTKRCAWAKGDPLPEYHDKEWGAPIHDDAQLFEFLVIEGAQAGLSWPSILEKRRNCHEAFASFDVGKVARLVVRNAERLLAHLGIIRNSLKITAAIANARKLSEIRKEFGSFDRFLWRFTRGRPGRNKFNHCQPYPPQQLNLTL